MADLVHRREILLPGDIEPFVRAGLGVRSVEGHADGFGKFFDETDLSRRIGAGVDVWVIEAVSISLEGAYVFSTDELDGFDYVRTSLGLAYRF